MVITAISVVPAPMSTTSTPCGFSMETPAPSAEATGPGSRETRAAPQVMAASKMVRCSSLVRSLGVLIIRFGRSTAFLHTRESTQRKISHCTEKSEMMPACIGRQSLTASGVRSVMAMASLPMASTSPE